MPTLRRTLVALCLVPTFAHAQSGARSTHHIDRLDALARLDAAVHYFHPAAALHSAKWDSAFADNAIRIADARNGLEYRRAIQQLVDGVGDAATRVVDAGAAGWASSWLSDSVLVLRAAAGAASDPRLAAKAAVAHAVIVDLRGGDTGLPEKALARVLLAGDASAPQQRALRYNGFPAATINSSGGYGLGYRVVDGETFAGAAARVHDVAFIVDSHTALPPLALALRASGRGQIVSVASPVVATAAESYRVAMGEGVFVDVRLAERSGAESGVQSDTVLSDATQAIALAAQRAGRPVAIATRVDIDTAKTVALEARPKSPEWNGAYPSVGYRVLAAARLWNTIHLFYPYKALMGESWSAAFRASLPAVEGAKDELTFGQSIAALAWHIHDSHVSTNSTALYRDLIGNMPSPVLTQFIEDKLIITRFIDSSAAREGLAVGDEVLTVDGEAIAQRIARLKPYLVSSTPQAERNRLSSAIMNGRAGGPPARLTVRNASGAVRTVDMTRPMPSANTRRYARTGRVFRMMPGNVGYVDLERLPVAMVDSMFRTFASTVGIVFDMRGYPQGTAWSIAPRLNTHPEPTIAAKFRRLVVSSPDTALTTIFTFDQPIPPAQGVTKYSGRTVMLIDERTISQAEHTGLFLEAANGTVFIGSATMGANGDVTNFILPGGIGISFTGHDVRHADGRQLQRVGLAPTVRVVPTVAGIRAGRDEVLEAGLKYVGGTGEVPKDTYVEPPAAPARALSFEPMPEGWVRMGNTDQYRIGLDKGVAHGGTASGHVTASVAGGGFGALNQTIRADSLRGQRVRFSAFIKTREVSGMAGAWMRVDGAGGMLAFDNMGSRPLRGTTDWTKVSVVLDVSQDAVGIALGMLVAGDGEAWIDDATLEVVGSDVPATSGGEMNRDPTKLAAQIAMYARLPLRVVNLDFERLP